MNIYNRHDKISKKIWVLINSMWETETWRVLCLFELFYMYM